MCRFLVYKGARVLVADLITHPAHSIIKQSYNSKERKIPLNGDGFGLGWYDSENGMTPGLFTSLTPAWANLNLTRLAEKIRAECLFAHVRAATPGLMVMEANCHPFQYKDFLWMHNGVAKEFSKIKRKLRASLKDPYYEMIQGTTDSEHAFALFLNFIEGDPSTASLEQLAKALVATIRQLDSWSEEAGIEGASDFNFAVTNGRELLVTRYASHTDRKPESLYYCSGQAFECQGDVCQMKDRWEANNAVIIASEPITAHSSEWKMVEPGTLLLVDANNTIQERSL